MRLRSIRFEPFGALRGVELDFGPAPGRLHVVWGPNEAGKSTALRGIVGFLFGIAHSTTDQHERGVELRVRARLVVDGGREIELVRRKGTKDPLRDGATDAGVPEIELSRWLGGIDEATFRQLHALDHATLRSGGESILRGEGRLGELMLEASTGATGLVEKLQALRDEAHALYRPRAKSTELQVALEAWRSATRAMGQASLAPGAWHEQERGIAATRKRVSEADQKLKEARAELARLEKLVALEDPLARLRGRRARRAQLGEVPDVPEGTAARRDELALELASSAEEAERSEAEIVRLGVERAAVLDRAGAVGARFDGAAAREIRASLDAVARAITEGEAELDEISRVRSEILEGLGDPPEGTTWTERTVDARDLARIQERAAERRAARAALAGAERAVAEAEGRLSHAVDAEPPAGLARAEEIAAIAAAVAAGRRAAAAAASVDALGERELDLVRRLAPALSITGVRTAEALETSDAPDLATIEAEARRRASEETAIAAIDRDRAGALDRAGRAAAALAALREGGNVPSDVELAASRRARGAAMDRARDAVERGDVAEARRVLDEVERAQLAADALADQLRREAARVEQVAAKEAERRGAEDAADALASRAAALRSAADTAREAFRAVWPATAHVPFEALRPWITARGEALAALDELRATRTRAAELRAEIAEAAGHLTRVGLPTESSKASLDAQAAAAEARLDDARAAARRREDALAARLRATSDRDAAIRGRELARQADEASEEAWREVLRPLGLGTPATLDEAIAAATALAGATRETRRHERAAARLGRLEAERARHLDAWRRALDGTGLEHVPPDEILDRAEQARHARAELPRIDDAIAQHRDVATRARARATRARARLDEILARAGVPDERLSAAEERARDARSLAREIATLEATLVEMTAAPDLAAAEAQVRDVDFARVAESAEQLARDVDELEASRTRDLHDLGAQQAELEEMERGRGKAAELAELAEAHLARARELTRRAAVARAAVAILEREIEKHRAEREGPVLRRASELFHVLTAGHWSGLRVGENDAGEPEIRAAAGARELGAKELSEGTRDQLYFALRLAALEHQARAGAPLPLILDDVLQNTDDERSEAAIRALADVAKTVQVLLFTHERHVAELARRVLAPGVVTLHEMERGTRASDAPL